MTIRERLQKLRLQRTMLADWRPLIQKASPKESKESQLARNEMLIGDAMTLCDVDNGASAKAFINACQTWQERYAKAKELGETLRNYEKSLESKIKTQSLNQNDMNKLKALRKRGEFELQLLGIARLNVHSVHNNWLRLAEQRDPRVRQALQDFIEDLHTTDPIKAFATEQAEWFQVRKQDVSQRDADESYAIIEDQMYTCARESLDIQINAIERKYPGLKGSKASSTTSTTTGYSMSEEFVYETGRSDRQYNAPVLISLHAGPGDRYGDETKENKRSLPSDSTNATAASPTHASVSTDAKATQLQMPHPQQQQQSRQFSPLVNVEYKEPSELKLGKNSTWRTVGMVAGAAALTEVIHVGGLYAHSLVTNSIVPPGYFSMVVNADVSTKLVTVGNVAWATGTPYGKGVALASYTGAAISTISFAAYDMFVHTENVSMASQAWKLFLQAAERLGTDSWSGITRGGRGLASVLEGGAGLIGAIPGTISAIGSAAGPAIGGAIGAAWNAIPGFPGLSFEGIFSSVGNQAAMTSHLAYDFALTLSENLHLANMMQISGTIAFLGILGVGVAKLWTLQSLRTQAVDACVEKYENKRSAERVGGIRQKLGKKWRDTTTRFRNFVIGKVASESTATASTSSRSDDPLDRTYKKNKHSLSMYLSRWIPLGLETITTAWAVLPSIPNPFGRSWTAPREFMDATAGIIQAGKTMAPLSLGTLLASIPIGITLYSAIGVGVVMTIVTRIAVPWAVDIVLKKFGVGPQKRLVIKTCVTMFSSIIDLVCSPALVAGAVTKLPLFASTSVVAMQMLGSDGILAPALESTVVSAGPNGELASVYLVSLIVGNVMRQVTLFVLKAANCLGDREISEQEFQDLVSDLETKYAEPLADVRGIVQDVLTKDSRYEKPILVPNATSSTEDKRGASLSLRPALGDPEELSRLGAREEQLLKYDKTDEFLAETLLLAKRAKEKDRKQKQGQGYESETDEEETRQDEEEEEEEEYEIEIDSSKFDVND